MVPIFIMSSERSGTNLLRMLLDNHPDIHGPRAPQLLKTFEHNYIYYMDNGQIDKEGLLEDIEQIVNHEYVEWKVELKGKAHELGSNPDFLDVWKYIYDKKADQMGVSHIACKENDIFHFAMALQCKMPEAKFLYLHRDVRDVCASWMKIPNGFKNVSQAAQNWKREQQTCLELIHTLGLSAIRIPYERLIQDTPGMMTEVLEFVGLSIDPACFNTDKEKGKSQDWNAAWKNLSKNVMSDNFKKYKKELSEEDILLIESRAHDIMNRLGYERDTRGKWEAPKQPVLHRIFKRLAASTEKAKYKNKRVEVRIEKLERFTDMFAPIKARRDAYRKSTLN